MVVLNSSSLLGETGNGSVSHQINMFAEYDYDALTFEEIRTAAADNLRIKGGNRNSLSVDDFEFGLGMSHTMLSGMQLEGAFRRFGKSVGGRVESINFGNAETGFVELSGFEPFQSKNILNKTRLWLSRLDEETIFSGDDVIIGTPRFDWEDGGTPELYGTDNLNGYAGDDYLDGNGGFDNIIGGEGRDTFVVRDYQAQRGSQSGNLPYFLDFNPSEDYILLDNINPDTLSLSVGFDSDDIILRGGSIVEGYTYVRQGLARIPSSINSLDEINFIVS